MNISYTVKNVVVSIIMTASSSVSIDEIDIIGLYFWGKDGRSYLLVQRSCSEEIGMVLRYISEVDWFMRKDTYELIYDLLFSFLLSNSMLKAVLTFDPQEVSCQFWFVRE